MNKFIPAAAFAFAVVALPAAPKIDLNRVIPVPSDQPIPTADFFRPPLLINPVMNKAGTHFAALVSAGEDKFSLLVCNLETLELETVAGGGNRDIHSMHWLGNGRLVFNLLRDKRMGEGLFAAEVGKLHKSYPLLQGAATQFVSVPDDNPLQPLIWIIADLDGGPRIQGRVARINSSLDTGPMLGLTGAARNYSDFVTAQENNRKHMVRSYPELEDGLAVGFLADKTGELEFGITSRDGFYYLHRLANRRWQKCPVDMDAVDVLGTGEKPGEIVVRSPREPGKPRAWQFMDATTGTLGEVLVRDDAYDAVGSWYRHPVSRQIIGVSYERQGPKVAWFTEAYRGLQKMLESHFPGQVVRIVGSDDAEKIFFVATYSDRHPLVYHRLDAEKKSLGLVKATRPWIDPARMRPMTIMKFKTGDGRQLDAYVTLPTGTTREKPAPLIVLPHGGPWARDTWGFDAQVQFLVSHGYAVLQPNYRGSVGYGWMFPEEDEWAFRKMHDDVTAATRTLLKSGMIDPERVAIMGWSFGAYLALCGATFEPDLYCCSITLAGIYDWERVMGDEKYAQFYSPGYSVLRRRLGDPKKQKEKFEEISPLRHVEQIRIPVFVGHGKDDPVASVGEARRLISALKKNDVPHEMLLVGGEGHGMHHVDNEVELYERVIAFLQQHVK